LAALRSLLEIEYSIDVKAQNGCSVIPTIAADLYVQLSGRASIIDGSAAFGAAEGQAQTECIRPSFDG
jgi:hypothetical protein